MFLIKTGFFYVRSSRLQGSEYEESDSGYSDPSPDGGAAQARSGETGNQSSSEEDEPNNNNTTADRKSVFSELSYEEDENDESSSHYQQQHDIFPTVIIKNQDGDEPEQRSSSPYVRQYGRQRSVFQTPGKDILTSLVSRDDLAVIGQESVDARTTTASPKQHRHSSPKEQRHSRHSSPHKCGRPAVYDETYRRSGPSGRRPPLEAVPGRHLAKQCEEKPEKNGCFYVMTALDFCWCL